MPFDSLPITSPVIEKLRLGRALIEARGLCRGIPKDPNGPLCAIWGITKSSYVNGDGTMDQAINYLAKAIPDNRLAIATWNDLPDTTKDDVIAAYDRAIDLAVADRLLEINGR